MQSQLAMVPVQGRLECAPEADRLAAKDLDAAAAPPVAAHGVARLADGDRRRPVTLVLGLRRRQAARERLVAQVSRAVLDPLPRALARPHGRSAL